MMNTDDDGGHRLKLQGHDAGL